LAKQVETDDHRNTLEEMAEAWRMVAAEADKKHWFICLTSSYVVSISQGVRQE
jgi:hypothetical protein